MRISTQWHVWIVTFVVGVFCCGVVSAAVLLIYPREVWVQELRIGAGLTMFIAMPVTNFLARNVRKTTLMSNELQRLLDRDRLTDVATRDFFFSRMALMPDAYGVSLMVDIDHFKSVNDTHGHITGDKVIRAVAEVMREQVRKDDIVCRFGGEEFMIFLAQADEAEGWAIAERIRSETADAITKTSSGDVQVTVSVGGSLKQQIEHVDAAIKRADECLYRAKEQGRNRTIVDWDNVEIRQSDTAA